MRAQGSDGHLNVCCLEKEEALLAQGECHAKNLGDILFFFGLSCARCNNSGSHGVMLK